MALVGDARDRQAQRLERRESIVAGAGALALALATLAALAWLPDHGRAADPLTMVLLVGLLAAACRVEFEVGDGIAVPDQLVVVPMLFLVPLPLVPVLVAAGFLLAELPDYLRGRVHVNRALGCVCDAWFAFGPVLVLAAGSGHAASLEHTFLYVTAFGAQIAAVAAVAVVRQRIAHGVPVRQVLQTTLYASRVDAVLFPLGLLVAMEAGRNPGAIAAIVPLIWLLSVFSQERKERYAASLELAQAYRGTVMLLSDVVEAEDNYTAEHCRSVVELVTEVAEALGVPQLQRQELEFAALLHDVGKIAVPKEILNKPSKLTDEEFEIIKRHTVEGQLLLDRVGGLLGRVGKIVRSCHERWDGGGYPDGLAGEEIPLAARIVFCCDAYNAMTTDRPYRSAMPREEAVTELRANTGTQFDPHVVTAVERVVRSRADRPAPLRAVSPQDAIAAAIGAARPGLAPARAAEPATG